MNSNRLGITTSPAVVSPADNYLPELLLASVTDYIDQLSETSIICQTAEQQARLVSLIADGNKLVKVITDERTKITKPLDKEKAQWISKERALTNRINQAMLEIKLSVDDYNQRQMRARVLEETTLRQQQQLEIGQKGEANWLSMVPPTTARPKGVRQVWSHRIIDVNRVPAEYLTVDVAKVKEAISAGARTIPGIDIYQETITTYRS